jgi:hypothetical protein
MRRVLVFVIAALALGAAGPSAVQTQSRAPLATNLSGMDDWSTEFSFVDAFKSSRPWISTGRWGAADPRPLDLDSRGCDRFNRDRSPAP